MNNFLRGLALGGAMVYLFDARMGKRRRALLRDKGLRSWRGVREFLDEALRDLKNRGRGVVAETRGMFSGDPADEDVLEARVRSKVGRATSHASGIEVRVSGQGKVTLEGPILADEVGDLLYTVRSVRGVKEVENRLDVHRNAEAIPSLQGGTGRGRPLPELLQERWSPGIRLLMGATGTCLALKGLRRSGLINRFLGLAGAGLLVRAIGNLPLGKLLGVSGAHRAVDYRKTLHVAAPLERVWEFWTNYENFPHFMTHVKEVRKTGQERSHWKVSGPAGIPVEWDAITTQFVPREVLAWKTVSEAAVEHAGVVHFEETTPGETRIDIRLSYHPPAGAIGDVIANLLGSDPRSRMDDDLVRLKTHLEEGKVAHDAAQRSWPGEELHS